MMMTRISVKELVCSVPKCETNSAEFFRLRYLKTKRMSICHFITQISLKESLQECLPEANVFFGFSDFLLEKGIYMKVHVNI